MMSVFREETETKRVIFNVRLDLAERLESAKEEAKRLGKKLDADSAVDKALERFLKKAEKKLQEMQEKEQEHGEAAAGRPEESSGSKPENPEAGAGPGDNPEP
jgi:hypothetical protein